MAPAGAHLQRSSAGQPAPAGPGEGWETSPREGLSRRRPSRHYSPGPLPRQGQWSLHSPTPTGPGICSGPTGLGRSDARRSPMLRQLRLHNFGLRSGDHMKHYGVPPED
ncbi:hypothetical protein NDU88_003632 [Pleurodeles waltl]|uniref:Uncharacterized protein n=1 Tax=Pleurodeles waltl TaxID=8319 RepID=A0AAV7UYZ1_PLEWA|nr:hypothetical protein NDU88_003632 [Pleurodeles waltl]